jgi:hypothetical protein
MSELERALAEAIRRNALGHLKVLAEEGESNPAAAHLQADQVLCNLLVGLGYADVVEEWRKVPRWYE